MKYRLIYLVVALLLLPGVNAYADDVRELGWGDLVPENTDFDDPYETLTEAQLYQLVTVAKHRQRLASEQEISESSQADYDEALTTLESAGVDIDGLIARRAEITEKRRARAQATNSELNGKTARMPGYLLPLEFKDKGVTEFLLVPWVGACVHMPPPPPNQIVHVVLDKDNAFHSKSRFEPVWVAGEILTVTSTKNLYLTDGSKDIDIRYEIQAKHVERYVQ